MGKDAIRSTALSAALLVGLAAGCSETSDGAPSSQEIAEGWQRGELSVTIADSLDGRSETTYTLRDTRAGAAFDTRLLFDSTSLQPAPELVTGVNLKVRGVDTADGLRVVDYKILPAADTTVTSALIGGTPYPVRNFAFVLINLNNLGVNTDATTVAGRLIGNPDSIRNYYLDDSYATQDITAQVFGPINYTMATCTNTDTSKLASDLRPMITGTFNHYLWYIGQSTGSPCTWGGLGSVGSPQSPARDTWYNGGTSCTVLVQEPGHNFGMQHSSTLACAGSSFLDDPNGCTDSEYGDTFDPMGNGCRHMNAWQKQYQGWFSGCNGVKISNTGTFTLLPFEPQCNGVQFLQIAMPKSRPYNRPAGGGGQAGTDTLVAYYVELRTPVDFDGTLGNRSALTTRVLVHVGAAPRTRTQSGIHTYLLDMTPSTAGTSGFSDAGLAVGQTFNDPAGGLTITNVAMSNSSATIQVTYTAGSGSPTCLDGSAFAAPGPTDCGMGSTGMGGAGGSAGGAGGRGGAGGSAGGATGTAGRGGVGGSTGGAAGRGGSTGTGGSTGVAGSTGTAGRGGSTGAGGSTGVAGSTGAAGSGAAGAGGSTGTAGAAGSGTTGTAGASGSTGTAGSTGAAGSGTTGTAGSTGTAGTGMVTGTAGSTGAAGSGATGSAGSTGAAGTGVITGVAGAIATGQGGQGGTPGEISGGCSCDTSGGGASSGLTFMLALSCVALGRARSPRPRQQSQSHRRSGGGR